MEKFRQTSGFRRKVLIVEDEAVNRMILERILSEDYDISCAENGQQAWDMIQESPSAYALILLDLLMPVMDGFQFLEKMKESGDLKSVPVIVMTSEKSAEVKSIRLGAADFITKPYDMPEVIRARCERVIELHEDKNIITAAERDDLTGLYSREFFYEYIRQIESYDGQREMDAVALDIEHFHMINEMYGREVGNEVLRETGAQLMDLFRDGICIAGRIDADCFYLYVDHRKDYSGVCAVLQEKLDSLTKIPKIRFRIGVCQKVDREVPAETWFDRAKTACDRVRGDYTRQISYYSNDENEQALFQQRLINDMDDAIRNRNFVVYYQPKYDIQGDEPRLRSAEALIRWQHPELGMISPGDFIPLFESNGLIQKLDRFVWNEAASQMMRWKEKYGFTIPVSVNVSRVDIYDPELEKRLLMLLEKNSLRSEELMLEITESAYSEDAEGLVEVVNSLRERGFRIEMDDFGSGYSSLNMITSIPIDVLKMDMAFIRNMNKDEKSMKLVELVLDIAGSLGVPAVAEGVEDEDQLKILKEIGCQIIQGYYFSRPVPPEEFEEFIREEAEKRTKEKEKGIC